MRRPMPRRCPGLHPAFVARAGQIVAGIDTDLVGVQHHFEQRFVEIDRQGEPHLAQRREMRHRRGALPHISLDPFQRRRIERAAQGIVAVRPCRGQCAEQSLASCPGAGRRPGKGGPYHAGDQPPAAIRALFGRFRRVAPGLQRKGIDRVAIIVAHIADRDHRFEPAGKEPPRIERQHPRPFAKIIARRVLRRGGSGDGDQNRGERGKAGHATAWHASRLRERRNPIPAHRFGMSVDPASARSGRPSLSRYRLPR